MPSYTAPVDDMMFLFEKLRDNKNYNELEKYKEVSIKNWMKMEAINTSGLIVNTSSLGMIGYPNLALSLKDAEKDTKVYDIVYNPQETTFIKEAKINKLEYTTGLSMFFGQAQESFKIWFKIRPVIDNYITSKISCNSIKK